MSENVGSLKIKMDVDMSSFEAGVDAMEKKIGMVNDSFKSAQDSIGKLADKLESVIYTANTKNTISSSNTVTDTKNGPMAMTDAFAFPSDKKKKNFDASQDDEAKYMQAVRDAINRQAVLMSK